MSDSTHVDNNLYSVYNNLYDNAPIANVDGLDLTTASMAGIDTPLKISHTTTFGGTGVKLPNGNETSVDIDVSTDITVDGDLGLGAGAPVTPIRVKGNSHHVRVRGTLHSRGSRLGITLFGHQVFTPIDVELGDWMDQDYGASSTIDLTALKHADGKKIRVAVGWVKPFTVQLGANCEYAVYASLALKAYVPTKRLIRFFLRIPVGTKGPSWF